jgi:hypothetical protein
MGIFLPGVQRRAFLAGRVISLTLLLLLLPGKLPGTQPTRVVVRCRGDVDYWIGLRFLRDEIQTKLDLLRPRRALINAFVKKLNPPGVIRALIKLLERRRPS